MILNLFFFFFVPSFAYGKDELIQNADFEEAFGSDNWFCFSCDLNHSTDAYKGNFSGAVTRR